MTVRGLRMASLAGRVKPIAFIRPCSSLASTTPPPIPMIDEPHAETERLGHHRPTHLSRRRANRAQQRQLRGALSEDDVERVEDVEGGDEERDASEREQHAADNAGEHFEGGRVFVGHLRAGDNFDAVGRIGSQRRSHVAHLRVVRHHDEHLVDQALAVQHAVRGGLVERQHVRAAEAVAVAELERRRRA